jgi:hypothetical protein
MRTTELALMWSRSGAGQVGRYITKNESDLGPDSKGIFLQYNVGDEINSGAGELPEQVLPMIADRFNDTSSCVFSVLTSLFLVVCLTPHFTPTSHNPLILPSSIGCSQLF